MVKILVLLGPNLNLTGIRKTDIYGTKSFDEINRDIYAYAEKSGYKADIFQSNHEGVLIDKIHETLNGKYKAVIINPGALTHYSYALRDAIESVRVPFIEVHMSDISKREDFRKISVLRDVCKEQIMGFGEKSYFMALDKIKEYI